MKHLIHSKFAALGLLGAGVLSLSLSGCNGNDNNGGPGFPTPSPSATASGTPNGTPNGSPTPSGTPDNRVFIQQERLARPAINEVLATVSNNRHRTNNRIAPTQDSSEIANDIRGFFKFPAGRSDAVANAAVSVLVPDVMKVNLSQPGVASYLGVETNGFTGGKFGGRKLQDDAVDIDLGAIFGNTIPKLGLAPDDGKELPQFSTDNVGFQGNGSTSFPYVAPPV